MKEPVVSFINLNKKIGKKTIIKDLSFDVYPGEVFGFLGPNGAGKTTTIRMLFGLMKMTSGDIQVEKISVKKDFEKAIVHVGGIVENPEMYKFMSGYKNLRQYARMQGNISKERIDEIVKQVGLQNRIHDKVKTYSLGMRQRLGLAQALLHDPKVIVLDEPTNGLDPAGIKELRNYLRELAMNSGVAVIVSSHILSEMELMCDRFGIIQNGELVDIQMVGKANSENNGEKIHEKLTFQAAQLEETVKVLNSIIDETTGEPLKSSLNGNVVEVFADYDQIPSIIKTVVENDIDLYEIRKDKKNLEDKFIELTGGNEIG